MVENNPITRTQAAVLLTSLFILSACAIVYELLISTISSYLLGSSVLHFSLTIGLFLSFLGVGAFLSRYVHEDLLKRFIQLELWLGFIGGSAALFLQVGYALGYPFYLLLVLLTGFIGILAGMEIPLITRILKDATQLRVVIAEVLAFDYLGSLIASIAFPILFLPWLGTMRTALLTGLINWAIGVFCLWYFRDRIDRWQRLLLTAIPLGLLLLVNFTYSFQRSRWVDQLQFQDPVLASYQSPYQRIVLTQYKTDFRLHLNGNLQFSSRDEYRYHEPLVHVTMSAVPRKDTILLLGGGDGLAVRELLKYPEVKHIDVVDLDSMVVDLAGTIAPWKAIHQDALNDPKVQVHFQDAYRWLGETDRTYEVMIADLPDPSDAALGKLYSTTFYELAKRALSVDGVFCTQSTSPYFARAPFWSIHQTMESVFPIVCPYNSYVPSFGLWGFNLGYKTPPPYALPDGLIQRGIHQMTQFDTLRFLSEAELPKLFSFPRDVAELPVPLNDLDRLPLVDLYEKSYGQVN